MHTQTASAIHQLSSNFRTTPYTTAITTIVSYPKIRPGVFFPRPPAAVTCSFLSSKIDEGEEESRKGQPNPATATVSASRRQRRPQNVDGDFFVGTETKLISLNLFMFTFPPLSHYQKEIRINSL